MSERKKGSTMLKMGVTIAVGDEDGRITLQPNTNCASTGVFLEGTTTSAICGVPVDKVLVGELNFDGSKKHAFFFVQRPDGVPSMSKLIIFYNDGSMVLGEDFEKMPPEMLDGVRHFIKTSDSLLVSDLPGQDGFVYTTKMVDNPEPGVKYRLVSTSTILKYIMGHIQANQLRMHATEIDVANNAAEMCSQMMKERDAMRQVLPRLWEGFCSTWRFRLMRFLPGAVRFSGFVSYMDEVVKNCRMDPEKSE